MTIKTRIEKLERRGVPHENGRMISAWEFPNNEAWEAAKIEHVERWPNHKGIRFIDDTSFRGALHDNQNEN